MNKQKKQFVVVVILMAVCIIGYFGVGKFYKNQEEKESENKEATAITAFELKDYEKITAFNYITNGTSITLTKDSDGKWHDSSDASVNISKDSVETDMLAKLVSVTADEKIAKKDDVSQYGFTIDDNGNVLYVESNNSTKAIDDKLVSLKIPDKVTKIDKAGNKTQVAVKSFNISSDGLITGVLETGEITALGQIAMSSFKNEVGLTDIGNNMYEPSGSSGAAIISSGKNSTAGRNSSGYGDILQGYLEMSGVDMAEQFTDMIVATKAFQAAGKTITTGDEILSEIINLKR